MLNIDIWSDIHLESYQLNGTLSVASIGFLCDCCWHKNNLNFLYLNDLFFQTGHIQLDPLQWAKLGKVIEQYLMLWRHKFRGKYKTVLCCITQ